MKDKELDPDLVAQMLGKRVLAGITYCDADGNPTEQTQFFGEIVAIDASGIRLRNPSTGQEFNMPPDFTGYTKAAPGEYRLRSTGEVVVNPDLLTTWRVNAPRKH